MSRYTVKSVSKTTPTILSLVLKHSADEKPMTFLSGQYATISYKRKNRLSAVRCFSIASSPTNSDEIEFGIRVAGKYTNALTKLKAGDSVFVNGPYGNFIFEQDIHQNIVMCAGGIGITPFMSMIRYATKIQLTNKMALIVSARNKQEIPYYDELVSLSSQNSNLQIFFVIGTDEKIVLGAGQKLYQGRITEQILSDASIGMINPVYFLCGPPLFMTAVSGMLAKKGVDQLDIITEAFAQGQVFKYGNTRDWPSTMYLAGVFGSLIAGTIIIANELSKSIAPTLLPDTLSTEQKQSAQGRQKELDSIVNELSSAVANGEKSPAVLKAEKQVDDANEKIAEINNSLSGSTSSSSASTSSSSSPSSQSTPTASSSTPVAPEPKPPAPVCTTSASGVTVCQ